MASWPSPCPPLRPHRRCPYVGDDAARRRRGQLPLRQALLPSGGTSWAGDAALRGHYHCWRLLLPSAALVGDSPGHGATPCGLATGSRHLRPGRGRYLRPQAPAMPAGDRACWRLPLAGRLPLQGGFGRGQPPPYKGPGPQPAAPCSQPGRGWSALHGGWPPFLLAVLAANA
ncbi:hypothetical protein BHE74_00009258 [Ensete ventricosum]|nr:hypothetical protein GW17_00053942 [Ensete ventricosum]RWW82286.1 hypothetical protein BHE74_00009258 [Ensete ventricosum]